MPTAAHHLACACLVFSAALSLVLATPPSFRFANTFGSSMVLQQGPNQSVLWGFGTPGAAVVVTLDPAVGAPSQCTVGEDGIWTCLVGPVIASFTTYTVVATSGGSTAVLFDVLFGDVWFCSGQSNMQFTVAQAFNASEEIAAAGNFPFVRLFSPALYASAAPLTELQAIMQPWSVASPDSVGGGNWTYFSAICWFYGRDLYQTLGYPIGLIDSTWGGTPVEAWSSPEALARCSAAESVVAEPSPDSSSTLWNSMVVPFLRTPVYGAIWYQGESDASYPLSVQYACKFPSMIADWRVQWSNLTGGISNVEFPFGFVMLSTVDDTQNTTCADIPATECGWALVRRSQTANYSYVPNPKMPNTFMSIAYDLGDPLSPFTDVHPRYKQQVASRLVNAGLAVAYGRSELYWTGPIAQQALQSGESITITFASTGPSGLFIKNRDYVHFEVESASGSWTPVPIISNTADTVTVSFAGSASSIRYNWYTAPCAPAAGPLLCAVYSVFGELPAGPFLLPVTVSSP